MTPRTLLLILIIFFSTLVASSCQRSTGIDISDAQLVQHGETIYNKYCSQCHGGNREGQQQWRKRKANGRLPAPPLDESGHAWHHADDILFGIVKKGLVPPYAPEGYQSDMQAWENVLSDRDIWAVLSFIKSRWPKEQQTYQSKLNKQ